MDLDPDIDNELKTPWNDWPKFYGDLPYIFAYFTIIDPNCVEFKFGILEVSTRKFKPLLSGDVLKVEDREMISMKLLKLSPVIRAVTINSVACMVTDGGNRTRIIMKGLDDY